MSDSGKIKLTAVHSIHIGAGQKPIAPGTVFELSAKDAKDLALKRAVRKPTDEELADYAERNSEDGEAAPAQTVDTGKTADTAKGTGKATDAKGTGATTAAK